MPKKLLCQNVNVNDGFFFLIPDKSCHTALYFTFLEGLSLLALRADGTTILFCLS